MFDYKITKKYFLFVNLKKYYFYQNQLQFSSYILLLNNIQIKKLKINIIKK